MEEGEMYDGQREGDQSSEGEREGGGSLTDGGRASRIRCSSGVMNSPVPSRPEGRSGKLVLVSLCHSDGAPFLLEQVQ